jgi:hypothetical protein
MGKGRESLTGGEIYRVYIGLIKFNINLISFGIRLIITLMLL